MIEGVSDDELRAELKRCELLARLCDMASYSTSRDVHYHTAGAITRELTKRGVK
jgi:hypothetical protein